jgi:hypothetical protein
MILSMILQHPMALLDDPIISLLVLLDDTNDASSDPLNPVG